MYIGQQSSVNKKINQRQMKSLIQEKPYNVRSITLRQVSSCQTKSFNCRCLMCTDYPFKREQEILKHQEEDILATVKQKITKKFAQSHLETVLKGLLMPVNKICKKGIEVYIPEICFFEDGEPSGLFFIKETDEPHLVKMKKDKITQTILLKILNDHRRNYRQKIKKQLKIQKLRREDSIRKNKNPKKGIIFSKGQNLTSAVVRYTDGCETLISETELILLLQKRKTDSAWKKISHIRNFISPLSQTDNPNPQISQFFNINFEHERPRFPALMLRASKLMQTYNTKLLQGDKDYISDQEEHSFCLQLKAESPEFFATYTFYKIAAFLQEFSDERVQEAQVQMFVNQIGQCFLLEAQKLTLKSLLKYNFTLDIHHKMVQQRQENNYHKKQLKNTEKTIEASEVIQNLMKNEYEEMKIKYGITNEPIVDLNQKLNNDFFAFLHPNLNDPLSELIKQDMPLTTFKRKILGEKEERKPLFRPFNSKFVRELHQLTPVKKHERMYNNWSMSLSKNLREESSVSARSPWRMRKTQRFSQTIGV